MSSKHFMKTSSDYEQQLNQLIFLLKAQQLSSKQKKPAIDEHKHKRLHNDYCYVEGRKLDRETNKSILPCRTSRQCVKTEVKVKERENPKAVNEKLKNFQFKFPVTSENISVKLDFTKRPNGEKLAENVSKKKDAVAPSQSNTKKPKQRQVAQYQLDHMYFVLDTNVLMDNLWLLEDVSQLTLRDTSGSILYIPYMVLKELDLLKCKQPTSFSARRAIEYLNEKFDDCERIQAQSALEEAEQLIDIDSADDSIINCCLQLKDELDHMILLTNDNNLRLKALASSIRVSTCYQLISCKGNWWSLPRERRSHRHHRYKIF